MEPLKTLNPALKSSPGNLANKLEQISTSIHKTIDKMSDATLPAVDRVASGAHQAVNKLADAAETIGAKADQLRDVQNRSMEKARVYVRENPLTSIGLAAGVGYLLSRIFTSR